MEYVPDDDSSSYQQSDDSSGDHTLSEDYFIRDEEQVHIAISDPDDEPIPDPTSSGVDVEEGGPSSPYAKMDENKSDDDEDPDDEQVHNIAIPDPESSNRYLQVVVAVAVAVLILIATVAYWPRTRINPPPGGGGLIPDEPIIQPSIPIPSDEERDAENEWVRLISMAKEESKTKREITYRWILFTNCEYSNYSYHEITRQDLESVITRQDLESGGRNIRQELAKICSHYTRVWYLDEGKNITFFNNETKLERCDGSKLKSFLDIIDGGSQAFTHLRLIIPLWRTARVVLNPGNRTICDKNASDFNV